MFQYLFFYIFVLIFHTQAHNILKEKQVQINITKNHCSSTFYNVQREVTLSRLEKHLKSLTRQKNTHVEGEQQQETSRPKRGLDSLQDFNDYLKNITVTDSLKNNNNENKKFVSSKQLLEIQNNEKLVLNNTDYLIKYIDDINKNIQTIMSDKNNDRQKVQQLQEINERLIAKLKEVYETHKGSSFSLERITTNIKVFVEKFEEAKLFSTAISALVNVAASSDSINPLMILQKIIMERGTNFISFDKIPLNLNPAEKITNTIKNPLEQLNPSLGIGGLFGRSKRSIQTKKTDNESIDDLTTFMTQNNLAFFYEDDQNCLQKINLIPQKSARDDKFKKSNNNNDSITKKIHNQIIQELCTNKYKQIYLCNINNENCKNYKFNKNL